MNRSDLFQQILKKQSFLCVGLDSDWDRLPSHLKSLEDPIYEFNKVIIDATKDLVVAYKPNTAFYEAMGPKGMASLKKTIEYIPEDIFVIADAKRGDIGNTSRLYAKSFFEQYAVDAITVAPYMGSDSVKPFLEYDGKWVIILGLTSNGGSKDFQTLELQNGHKVYETVLSTAATYGSADDTMFVIGATKAEYFENIRKITPDHFYLVPGVGAQGGSLEDVCKYGMNDQVGLLVNSSRSIIFASDGANFGEASRDKAKALQQTMASILQARGMV